MQALGARNRVHLGYLLHMNLDRGRDGVVAGIVPEALAPSLSQRSA
jgi:hypothetical protein